MSKDVEDAVDDGRRNALKTLGGATAGALSLSILDSDIVRGVTPESTKSGDVDWSAGGGESGRMFPLSVASGGPTPSGAILWTKLDEDACKAGKPVYVQVARDEGFSQVVYEGRVPAEKVTAEHDFVVKPDLDGELPGDAHLFYRFRHDGVNSQAGRVRTLPTPDASPESLRMAVVTCQSFQSGYYPAYSYIAREDLDYLVHLGDQIYEYAGDSHLDGRSISLPSGHDVAWGLEDFRHLWSTYRGDEFFQRALERHTLIPTWDDHEIVNNRYWDYENERPWSDSHPKNDDGEFMTRLFVDGIRAWWEYNPARVEYDPDADTLLDSFHMWRSVRFGDLVELPVTDERLFSSLPPGGDAAGQRQWGTPPHAPERDDGDRTKLGFEQREWLIDTLTESDATWKVWANELAISEMVMALDDDAQFAHNYDSWDGYTHERDEILGRLTHDDVDNFVAFTGDWHTYLASYLMNGFEDTFDRTPVPSSEELVGVEFMTPAVSSNAWASDFWGEPNATDVESESPELTNERMTETILEENPHIEFFNGKYNGYSVAEFTPDSCTWTTYAVDDTVDRSDAPRAVLRKYEVPEGEVDLKELEANDLENGFSPDE